MGRIEYRGHHIRLFYLLMELADPHRAAEVVINNILNPKTNAVHSADLGLDYAGDIFGEGYNTERQTGVEVYRQKLTKVYSKFLAASDSQEVVLMVNKNDDFCNACPGKRLHCAIRDNDRLVGEYTRIKRYYDFCLNRPEILMPPLRVLKGSINDSSSPNVVELLTNVGTMRQVLIHRDAISKLFIN